MLRALLITPPWSLLPLGGLALLRGLTPTPVLDLPGFASPARVVFLILPGSPGGRRRVLTLLACPDLRNG